MKKSKNFIDIILPKNQLYLYGYDKYFKYFVNLHKKSLLPHAILLSGPKGLGKATFAYHFINYILSYDEDRKYLLDEFKIDSLNKSYANICNDIHPNFSIIENEGLSENIKIDSIKKMLRFLNKSTYSSNLKIVLIDNAENLNIYSSNSILKSIEEADSKTFFFIIHNSNCKILDTIKSRCLEFKFFFQISDKKKILENIISSYDINFNINDIDESFYFDTPGNILKYLTILSESKLNISKDKLSCILYLVDMYKQKNDPQLLNFASFLVELYFNDLSLNNSKNLNLYFSNKLKILNQFNDLKKYNLDKKNLYPSLEFMLKNEQR